MKRVILCFIISLLHLQAIAGEVININSDNPLRPILSIPLTKKQAVALRDKGVSFGKEVLGLYMIVGGKVAKVPVAGSYSVKEAYLYYTPMYELGYGIQYVAKAKVDGERVITEKYSTPANLSSQNRAVVVSGYPLADTIPYNTLYFHVRFSQPMLGDNHAYKYIKIYDDKGIERPKAWRQKSFWLDSGKLLVLMIHPGRVKNGIHYESPLFDSGKSYKLKVLEGIKDANGNRLKCAYEQQYYVAGEDRVIPKMNNFFISQSAAKTRAPIKIHFSEGMDNASVLDGAKVIDNNGNEINCKVRESETDFTFTITPTSAWKEGNYTLKLKGSVSDYSGNRMNRLFEIKEAKEIEKDAQVNQWEFEIR